MDDFTNTPASMLDHLDWKQLERLYQEKSCSIYNKNKAQRTTEGDLQYRNASPQKMYETDYK